MSRTGAHEYLCGGIEISNASHSSSGTLGFIVRDNRTMRAAILTNRHVVLDDDAEVVQNVNLIMQRAKFTGKLPTFCSKEVFEAWQKEHQTGQWRRPVFQAGFKGGSNAAARLVAFVGLASKVSDAALCPLIDGVRYACDAVSVNNYLIPGTAVPKEGLTVMKSGKVTGITYGRIKQIEGDLLMIEPIAVTSKVWPIEVHNPDGSKSFVSHSAGPISDRGDSGSIWVSADPLYYPRCAVGLLWGGHGSGMSLAYNIQTVMTKLNFSFVSVLDILD